MPYFSHCCGWRAQELHYCDLLSFGTESGVSPPPPVFHCVLVVLKLEARQNPMKAGSHADGWASAQSFRFSRAGEGVGTWRVFRSSSQVKLMLVTF